MSLILKGPVTLIEWGAFCAQCKSPIHAGAPAFLEEDEDGPDAYIHRRCITAYVKAYNEEMP